MRRRAAFALLLCLLWHFGAPLAAVGSASAPGPRQIEMPRATAPGDWLPQAAASETLARPPHAAPVRLPLAAWRPPAGLLTLPHAGGTLPARAHRAHYPPRRLLRRRLARPGDDRPA